MKKTTKIIISSLCIISILSISVFFTSSLLEDSVSVSNSFISKGNCTVELTETEWDSQNGENIYPLKVLPKNPTLKNTGTVEEYVYMQVQVPVKKVKLVGDNEEVNFAKETELFSYTLSDDWTYISSDITNNSSGSDYHTYICGYKKVLSPGDTTSFLFDSVTYANVLQGEIPEGTTLSINVSGIGVQYIEGSSLEKTYRELK